MSIQKLNIKANKTGKFDIKKSFQDNIEKNKEEIKKYLKQRVDIRCKCKKQKSNENDRVKYGVCRCDAFSMYYTLGKVLGNYLYQYLADAKPIIVRNDWAIIEEHAKAIREYTEADSWDFISKNKKVKKEYINKEKNFKKAIKYLIGNWQSFWW